MLSLRFFKLVPPIYLYFFIRIYIKNLNLNLYRQVIEPEDAFLALFEAGAVL
jgi:hypothetical protein